MTKIRFPGNSVESVKLTDEFDADLSCFGFCYLYQSFRGSDCSSY